MLSHFEGLRQDVNSTIISQLAITQTSNYFLDRCSRVFTKGKMLYELLAAVFSCISLPVFKTNQPLNVSISDCACLFHSQPRLNALSDLPYPGHIHV